MADKLLHELKDALGDAYTIERELAGGGMSRVFVAREHALGREVVIKVLPPELAAGVNRDRFRREVQLAARLSHPYIVPLLNAGEHGELLWFTMPYIAGESLRTRLTRGRLPVGETVRLLHDVVEALAYAHSRGVVHRDIKPGNILTDGQHALVTDFGVAKALNAALPNIGPGHTTSGMAIGTPAYMAPEQLAADPDADHRVDIYAAGLLAYEMLTGESPFSAPSPTATMTAQLTRLPEPLHHLHPDVPPALSDLVQRCLAKAPDDRPPDANTVLVALDRISGALAAHAHRATVGDLPTPRHASMFPILVSGLVTIALVAGGFLWNAHNTRVQHAATTLARMSGDTSDLTVALPRALTRQDSLNIANALRDQLQQIGTRTVKPPAAKPMVPDTQSVTEQIRHLDSLTRLLLSERNAGQIEAPGRVAVPVAPMAPAPGMRPGDLPQIAATATAPRRLAIFAVPMRGADSTLRNLQEAAAGDLARRAGTVAGWSTINVDTAPEIGGRRTMPSFDADVLVFLLLQREQANPDSVVMHITLRSASAENGYGFRYLSSPPAYRPTSIEAFHSTLRDAGRLLQQLRRLPPGQPWPQDMGRDWTTSGPFAGRGPFYRFPDDSLRHVVDSATAMARRLHGRRDS